MDWRWVSFSILLVAAVIPGCAEDPPRVVGETCQLTSECSEPLVCRLERCRRECNETRDCAAGLSCVLNAEGLGACLLPEELTCALVSECRAIDPGLVCAGGVCTNECEDPRDCLAGAMCVDNACIEPESKACVWNSDCDETTLDGLPLACGPDQRCRVECFEDRDCESPRVCLGNRCHLPDGGA